MKPLYCYRIDESSGTITKYTITYYRIRLVWHRTNSISYYHNLGNKSETRWEVYESNLDKVVHMKLHTFNDDDIFAYHLILEHLEKRQQEAYDDYCRWKELYGKIKEKH